MRSPAVPERRSFHGRLILSDEADLTLILEVLSRALAGRGIDDVRGVDRDSLTRRADVLVPTRNDLCARREVVHDLNARRRHTDVGEIVGRIALLAFTPLGDVAGVRDSLVAAAKVLRQEPVKFVAQPVRTDGDAVRPPVGRNPVAGDRRNRSVRLLLVLDGANRRQVAFGTEPAVAPAAVVGARQGSAEQAATEIAVHVVVVVRQDERVPHESDARIERQFGRWRPVVVQAAGPTIERIVRRRPVFGAVIQRDVVTEVLPTSPTRPLDVGGVSGAERVLTLERVVAHQEADCLSTAQGIGARWSHGRRAAVREVVRRSEIRFEQAKPNAKALGEPRSLPSFLRDDLNHARGRIGAVQRGGSGALHDFHGLEVLRIELGEPARDLTADAKGVRRARRDLDAVHEDERLVAQRDRRRTANADMRVGARRAGSQRDRNTGNTRLEHLLHGPHWRGP